MFFIVGATLIKDYLYFILPPSSFILQMERVLHSGILYYPPRMGIIYWRLLSNERKIAARRLS